MLPSITSFYLFHPGGHRADLVHGGGKNKDMGLQTRQKNVATVWLVYHLEPTIPANSLANIHLF